MEGFPNKTDLVHEGEPEASVYGLGAYGPGAGVHTRTPFLPGQGYLGGPGGPEGQGMGYVGGPGGPEMNYGAYDGNYAGQKKSNEGIEKEDFSNKDIASIKKYIDPRPGNSGISIIHLNTTSLNAGIEIPPLPADPDSLTNFEQECIRYYTGTGYESINKFLFSTTNQSLYNTKLISALQIKFPKSKNQSEPSYKNQLVYYYFVNLYNIIQKGPQAETPFKVYRGTSEPYLKEDKSKFYFLNSFSSTSLDLNIAKGSFGKKNTSNEPRSSYISEKFIYEFYVHPLCRYMNLESLSVHPREKEILLTPYHRYYYIDEETTDTVNHHIITEITTKKTFAILPISTPIPDTYNKFYTWKNKIGSMIQPRTSENEAKPKIVGGRTRIITPNNGIKVLQKRRNLSQKTAKIKQMRYKTAKIKQIHSKTAKRKQIEKEKVTNRFTDPIPSFPGSAPTEEELKVIQQMVDFFRK